MIQASRSALSGPIRTFLFAERYSQTRFCSGFVSRMRYINRLKENDAACVSALQNGHIFLFHHLLPLLHRSDPGTFKPVSLSYSEVQSVLQRCGSDGSLLKESILIGCSEQSCAQFCLDVGGLDPTEITKDCNGTFVDLRKAFFLLEGSDAPLVAKAQALLQWHQINRFCGSTGELTTRNQAGSQRFSSSKSIIYYPKMSPVVIFLVSDGNRCLLGRQASFPRGLYSALAGFCDMGEILEEALRREAAEEVGLEVENITYSSSQHWPFPHSSFMLACHATVSPAHSQLSVDQRELEDARWFTEEEITRALQVKAPPRKDLPAAVWLPPKHAVANHLITEWRDQQQRRKSTVMSKD